METFIVMFIGKQLCVCSVGGVFGQLVPEDHPSLHSVLRDARQSHHAAAGPISLHRQRHR